MTTKEENHMTDKQLLLEHMTGLISYLDKVRKGEMDFIGFDTFIDEIRMIRQQIQSLND
jgi:hypothetical protein